MQIQFEPIRKPDNEVIELFTEYRKIFRYNHLTCRKQLAKLINYCVAFYKVYPNGVFEGCLFIYEIDHDKKTVEIGGFAKRKAHTQEALKSLIGFINKNWQGFKIIADTKELAAKMCLRKLHFNNTDEKGVYCYG